MPLFSVRIGSLCAILLVCRVLVHAGNPIPSSPDGWSIGSPTAPVVLEVFGDTMCPDTARAYPTMLNLTTHYGPSRLKFTFHAFSLPFIYSSWLAHQGLWVVYNNNPSQVWSYIDGMLENQASFRNRMISNMTTNDVIAALGTVAEKYAAITKDKFIAGIANPEIFQQTITSWKYIASRGVSGTPTFYVNGVLIDADPTWTTEDWEQLLDSVIPPPSADASLVEASQAVDTENAGLGCAARSELPVTSDNSTCPAGETACEVLPGKFQCCFPGEFCIKNEGCTCMYEELPIPKPCAPRDAADRLPQDNSTCPAGETACEILPGKYECCYPGEFCIKNEGCTCMNQEVPTPKPCTARDEAPERQDNSTCPAGETACEVLSGKYECCYPGEFCIKNEGCTCMTNEDNNESADETSEGSADDEAVIFPPHDPLSSLCHKAGSAQNTNATCPTGEFSCEVLPNKFVCCYAGDFCIRNYGCTC